MIKTILKIKKHKEAKRLFVEALQITEKRREAKHKGEKKRYDQPRQLIKKQRHYFANKVHLVKATLFPVLMYGCESWTIKKAEC